MREGQGESRGGGKGLPELQQDLARKDPARKEMCSSDEGTSRPSLFVASIGGAEAAPWFFITTTFFVQQRQCKRGGADAARVLPPETSLPSSSAGEEQ